MEWKTINHKELSNPLSVTDDMLKQWEIEYLERDKINKEKYDCLVQIKERMLTDAIIIYGERSNVVSYIRKQKVPKPFTESFASIRNKVYEAREMELRRLKEIELEQKNNVLVEKAVNYLIEDGLKLGIDFTIDEAISRANDIVFIKEVSKVQQSDTYISFSGDDSCENCSGWDGISHRCDCGNRRVTWESDMSKDFFLNPYIYGQAY